MNIITANTCKTCKHSWPAPDNTTLFCRRYPPTVCLVPTKTGQPIPVSTYAPIQPDQSCGEYKPKIALEN